MSNRKKICVVTGSRAEYGLLFWVMKEIATDPNLELQLVVTCMHLSKEFGETYKLIEEDGFTISKKVEILLSSDTKTGTVKSIGLGAISFCDIFSDLSPDFILVLGDRFEIFSAVQSAYVLGFPIGHIHGGEVTLGAIDEGFRHAITKMSHYHFVSTETYGKRVHQLGENPDHIYFTGAPGIDNIKFLQLDTKAQLEERINLEIGNNKFFLVTYHPETLSDLPTEELFSQVLQSLSEFPEAKILFTKANADPAGRLINKMIDTYVGYNRERAVAFTSMGQVGYLSALKHCDVVIGNSSSGIIEAPYFGVPTVNIGARQDGRISPKSVLRSDCTIGDITKSIDKAIASPWREEVMKTKENLYGVPGEISKKIKEVIKTISQKPVISKKFFDIEDQS